MDGLKPHIALMVKLSIKFTVSVFLFNNSEGKY